MEQGRAIYACDVGSCRRGNFAWARIGPEVPALLNHSPDIEELVSSLEQGLRSGLNIALGFEAPLFVPVPEDPDEIGRARTGEGNRPYSAGAGASAALIGVQQAAWVMGRIRPYIGNHTVITDWRLWTEASGVILLWEAFVSGSAKGDCHADDAVTAAREFERREKSLHSDVTCGRALSLVGTAALWAEITTDPAILHLPVLVLRSTERFKVRTMIDP